MKIFKILKIIQIVDNEERKRKGLKKLGKGYFEAYRANPYNPLSYLFVFFNFISCFLLTGRNYIRAASRHKSWKIEVEMAYSGTIEQRLLDYPPVEPKLTNGKIKILKVL